VMKKVDSAKYLRVKDSLKIETIVRDVKSQNRQNLGQFQRRLKISEPDVINALYTT
jgi:hypothetical protein